MWFCGGWFCFCLCLVLFVGIGPFGFAFSGSLGLDFVLIRLVLVCYGCFVFGHMFWVVWGWGVWRLIDLFVWVFDFGGLMVSVLGLV